MKACPVCSAEVIGHPNKLYCSQKCKNRRRYLDNKEKILLRDKRRYEDDPVSWKIRVRDYRYRVAKRFRVYHYQITCPKCGDRGQLKSNVEINTHTDNRLEYFLVTHVKSVREGKKIRKVFLRNCYLGSQQKVADKYGLAVEAKEVTAKVS